MNKCYLDSFQNFVHFLISHPIYLCKPIPPHEKMLKMFKRNEKCYLEINFLQTLPTFNHLYWSFLCIPQWSMQAILRSPFSGSILLTVGNVHCLVILWQKSARRDKVCPQYRVRNWTCTNDIQTPCKLYGPLEITSSTLPFKNDEI